MSVLLNPLFSADVDKREGVSSTEYRIKGDLGSVFKEITALFKEFPAVGYGTRVHSIDVDYPNGDKYTARMSRQNSCD